MRSNRLVKLAAVAATFVSMAPHFAMANLVVDGNFDQGPVAGTQMTNSNVAGWSFLSPSSSSYSFIFNAADASSSNGTGVYFWGPNDGSSNGNGNPTGTQNGLTASPDGGNFLAQDPVYQSNAITQTITGLTVNAQYTLTFYWAGVQQHGYDGTTTEGWQVTFGNQTYNTGTSNGQGGYTYLANANHGFTGWQTATVTFTASATSQALTFLAEGTPNGVPPFALLDGVSLVASAVPEPATWGLMIAGLLGVAGFAARRRASV